MDHKRGLPRGVRRERGEGKKERMREPLFCKKAVPAPSAKNSYMADGGDSAFAGAGLVIIRRKPGPRIDRPECRSSQLTCWKPPHTLQLASTGSLAATKHLGVFGEGSGEGVFAKTPFPETLASAHSAVNSFVEVKAPMSLPEGPHV